MDEQASNAAVDDLALRYLRGAESGDPPAIEDLAAELPDEATRVELRALVNTTEWARSTFPLPFRPQQKIAARYTLLEELGVGGFGRVWRARDEKVGRDVALKMFHSLLEPEKIESTLRRERESLARVNHEGIVRLLDSGRHEDTQFLVTEFVEGRPLDAVLERLARRSGGTRPDRAAVAAAIGAGSGTGARAGAESLLEDDWFRTAARIGIAMLRALGAAHDQRIHHRDLKPGNVVIRPDGSPVILDFGLAGLGDEAQGTLTGRLFGTVAYMAPEQIENMRTGKDARTDIYQCGLLLYEMLTFRRTFHDGDHTTVLEMVRRGLVTSPRQLRPDVPRELADICLRALERNPERRYATADAFRADLERWLAGELPAASRLGTAGRAWRGARRWTFGHRTAVVAALLVLLGIGSTAWFAAPGPAALAAEEVGDGEYDLTTTRPGTVCAWLVGLDPDGRSVGTCPVMIQIGSRPRERQLELPAGTTRVRVVEDDSIDGVARSEVRWFLATDQQARDWMTLIQRVAREARDTERLVDNDRVRDIHAELLVSGRGGEGIGPLPLDELLR